MTRSLTFPRNGDKQNSPFFEDYLLRLLEDRDRSGLTDMIDQIEAIMITVDPGQSIRYIGELALMTPYNYLVTLESKSHWTHILRVDMNSPDFLVREVKDRRTRGIFRSLNEVYPIGARKPNSRYMGEILRVQDLHGVVECQQGREFRFFSQDELRKLELPGNLAIVKPSSYTHNILSYMERPLDQLRVYALGNSSINNEVQEVCLAAKELQKKLRINDLILPIEHVVSQIAAQGRNFLLDVIGSRDQGLKQIFSSASEHSSLIIEYVQRFGDFQGFFTKENVAELTHAAGVDEELLELQAQSRQQRS